ncbi:CYP27A1, partial [Symbiodinium natans]
MSTTCDSLTFFPVRRSIPKAAAKPKALAKAPAPRVSASKGYKQGWGGHYDACPAVKVLEDTETGWPGKCLGLKKVVVPYGETCEGWCTKQVSCSVWQEIKAPNPYKPNLCFHTFWSSGVSCYTRTLANGTQDFRFKPTRAQRIMRGEVRVLKKIAFAEIDGLKNVFDENYFAKVQDAAQACRMVCYSDLGCQWWYYSNVKGCFVEDISYKAMPVPLTLSQYQNNTKSASQVLHGEYIQHTCQEAGDAAVSSHEPIPEYNPLTSATSTTVSPEFSVDTTDVPETVRFTSPVTPVPIAGPGKDAMTAKARAIAKEEVNMENLFAVGALTAVGVDFNQIPDDVREKLKGRFAELISANTGVSKYDVLDLSNEAGKTSLSSWQTHNPVFTRRLQTTEPAIAAYFKMLNPKGTENFDSAQSALTSGSFQRQMSAETMVLLKDVPHALQPPNQPPRVQAHVRESNLDDLFPEGGGPKATSHNHFQTWLVVLGLALVAAIAALAYWVYSSSNPARKKVSFDGEDDLDLVKLKGSQEDWERSAREVQVASSPSKQRIEEAELRAQQLANDLAKEFDAAQGYSQAPPQGPSGYGQSGYIQSGYGQSALPSPVPLISPSVQYPYGSYGSQTAPPAQ